MDFTTELKTIIDAITELHNVAAAASRAAVMASLPEGAAAPKSNVILGDEARQLFLNEASKHLSALEQLVNAQIGPVKEKITAAPSTEALNAISLLSIRKNISETDIDLLMEKYGDNYQAAAALASIAADRDIAKYKHYEAVAAAEIEKMQELEELKKDLVRLLTDPNGIDRTKISFLLWMHGISLEDTVSA